MATTKRIIPPVIHKDGSVHYESVTSKPDDSIAACGMVPNRIIPVIFVPGVMGSNLESVPQSKGEKSEPVWLVNSKESIAADWLLRGAEKRKRVLDPTKTTVYRYGSLPKDAIPHSVFQTHPAPTPEDIKAELIRRGWGEVAYKSYGEWLKWLEEALNDSDYTKTGLAHSKSQVRPRLMKERVAQAAGIDLLSFDEVALSYRYQFPVHAVGYNWLQSNADSARRLQQKIEGFMAYYSDKGYMCDKVILVTHSMGGLVARYYTEILSKDVKAPKKKAPVLGVVHGVMPTTGSATAYKRVKAGTEGVIGMALGANAAEMTAVFAQAPGPLQLLPSSEYGYGWLKIKDGEQRISLPQRPEKASDSCDPYGEIYTVRGKWWGLIDDQLINPLDEKKLTIDKDWENFTGLIDNSVQTFHEGIANHYHPQTYAFYGDDKAHATWGDVVWQRHVAPHRTGFPAVSLNQSLHPAQQDSDGKGTVSVRSYAPAMPHSAQYLREAQFIMGDANESGDGTVPIRSGRVPAGKAKVCAPYPGVDHESAYQYEAQQLFALWAIVKIAQNVKGTRLEYTYITECKA